VTSAMNIVTATYRALRCMISDLSVRWIGRDRLSRAGVQEPLRRTRASRAMLRRAVEAPQPALRLRHGDVRECRFARQAAEARDLL
jgi:hypothetical protein